MDILKAVIFRLRDEEFGVAIQQVVSIERMYPITRVPNTPKHVMGVMNLRGNVIPVVDLNEGLTGDASQLTEQTRIIVLQLEDRLVGITVDEASDVMDLPQDSIQSVDMNRDEKNVPMQVAKIGERLLILMDMNQFLQNMTDFKEMNEIKQLL